MLIIRDFLSYTDAEYAKSFTLELYTVADTINFGKYFHFSFYLLANAPNLFVDPVVLSLSPQIISTSSAPMTITGFNFGMLNNSVLIVVEGITINEVSTQITPTPKPSLTPI